MTRSDRNPLAGLVRHRWQLFVLIAAATLAQAPMLEGGEPADWGYLKMGAKLLTGSPRPCFTCRAPGGLHLYANYPSVQIGPLALLCARGMVGAAGLWLAVVVMATMGLLFLWLVEEAARQANVTISPVTALLGAAVFLLAWRGLTVGYGHLDDALVVVLAAAAVLALLRGHALAMGLAVGLALAMKPTAIVAVPLLAALPPRAAVKAAAVASVAALVAWSPFVLADHHTLTAAGTYVVVIHATSPLRLFGLASGAPGPHWVRLAQLSGALLLGLLLVRAQRWQGVLLAGFAVRIAFDPGDFTYYASSAVAAAYLCDTLSSRRLPLLTTTAAMSLVALPDLVGSPLLAAGTKAVGCCALIAGAFLRPAAPLRPAASAPVNRSSLPAHA